MEERQIRTGIDRFLDLVNSGKELKLSDASKKLKVPESTLEIWADILLKESLVEVGYDGFGKMVVRRSPAEKQKPEAEGPITELSKNAPPKAAEHMTSLRERLSGMKRKKGHRLLKKYSGMRKNTAVPDKGGIVSRFLTLFKGSFKRSEGNKSGRVVPIMLQSQSGHKTANPQKKSTTNNDEDLYDLSKRIAALKKKVES